MAGQSRPWQRAYWLFDRLEACPVHQVALVDDGVKRQPSATWDFPGFVRSSIHRIRALAISAQQQDVASADRYFALRLAGTKQDPVSYLDALPFYVAVQLCEYLGSVDRGNNTVASEFQALRKDRATCRQRGFEIAEAGKQGLFRFFDDRDRKIRTARAGKHVIYGSVYRFLSMKLARPEVRPLIDDLREHAAQIMVLHSKELFLGEPLKSVVQSVRQASLKYEVDERRLMRMLEDLNISVNNDAGAWRTTFDEDQVREVLAVERDHVSIEGAKRDQGYGRNLIRKLVELGAPIRTNLATKASRRNTRYSRTDVEAYFATVFPRSVCDRVPLGYKPIMTARLVVGCSVAELLQMIHLGTLKDTKRLRGEKSLANLLIRIDEARPHLMLPNHDGLLLKTVASILHADRLLVRSLITAGLLVGEMRKHPLRRKTQVFVTPESLKAFQSQYVFLAEIAGSPARCRWERKRLDDRGIAPVEVPNAPIVSGRRVQAFYRRADLS